MLNKLSHSVTQAKHQFLKSKNVFRKLVSSFRRGGIADPKWSKTDALSSLSPKVRPSLILSPEWDELAYLFYSTGRYNCVGKSLALPELRYVVRSSVTRFEICFCPGDDGQQVEKDMKDQFTAGPGKLELMFRKRL